MNFQYIQTFSPLKVLVVNPLSQTGRLTIVKILSGSVFGSNQLIDLILLVYFNERSLAETFRTELYRCAFSSTNTIEISSDLPNVSDADIFCFITEFKNPNYIDFKNIEYNEHFDTMYLIIKIANHFSKLLDENREETTTELNKKKSEEERKRVKPVFITDGLVALDILYTMSRYLSSDAFFCPTPLTDLARSVLGEHLKVKTYLLNDVFVWAANDEDFYLEIKKPLLKDRVGDGDKCDRDMLKQAEIEALNLDHTQFNASWMKKDWIKKVATLSKENPYGCIFKASQIANALKIIWTTRVKEDGLKLHTALGVISDGSLDTIKGCPYVLPLVLCQNSWSVNKRSEEEFHLRGEIKRINKSVKRHHKMLIPYCKKFLEENVIKQAFVPDDQSSVISSVGSQQIAKLT